jgi:hypothetical protein
LLFSQIGRAHPRPPRQRSFFFGQTLKTHVPAEGFLASRNPSYAK